MTMNDKEAGKTECFLGISDPFRILHTQRITRPGLEDLKKTQGKLPRFKKAVQNPVQWTSKSVQHGQRFGL